MSGENPRVTSEGSPPPPFVGPDGQVPATGAKSLAPVLFKSLEKDSTAAAQARAPGQQNPTGEGLGELGNQLFLDAKWDEAKRKYEAARHADSSHELAAHWDSQIRLCSYNLKTAPEVEVTDPQFARPSAVNASFPKPVPDALNVPRVRLSTKWTVMGSVRWALGRSVGWICDRVIDIGPGMIRRRSLFGSTDRPRHTNWYIQRQALTWIRIPILRYTLADIVSLFKLMKQRNVLEGQNLFDSYKGRTRSRLMPRGTKRPATAGIYRQTDGTWTDLRHPTAGAAYTLFGRNTDPAKTRIDNKLDAADLTELSEAARVLLHCDRPGGQVQAPFVNTLAAWWIQFETHDWVVAGDPSPTEVHVVPLGADDPRRKTLGIDAVRVPKRVASPHKYLAKDGVTPRTNIVTAWWDASQIYGSGDTDVRLSNGELVACGALRARSAAGEAGKGAYLDLPDGRLPVDKHGVEMSGMVNRAWHLGLSFLHTLFAKEHNAIVDMLKSKYPTMGEQELFQTARLVNAAVIARIHTVEWTPAAVMPNRITNFGLNGNWYGLFANWRKTGKQREALRDLLGIEVSNREFGGIIGGTTDDHGVEYSLTQEFLAVYRLHPLMMDELTFRSIDGTREWVVPLAEMRMKHATELSRELGYANIAYSAGTTHPGQLVLNNFPRTLTELAVPGFPLMDLAMVDLLRDLEDGVPRFNEYRRRWGHPEFVTWTDFTDDATEIAKLKGVYQKTGMSEKEAIDRVHLLVGTLASAKRPSGFGFGEELFTLFILNASRRLEADPFFTKYYDAAHYTEAGLNWVDDATFKGVLLRHYPELAQTGLANVENAFEPWDTDPQLLNDRRRHPLMYGGEAPVVRD